MSAGGRGGDGDEESETTSAILSDSRPRESHESDAAGEDEESAEFWPVGRMRPSDDDDADDDDMAEADEGPDRMMALSTTITKTSHSKTMSSID